jgi:hypothetical protein
MRRRRWAGLVGTVASGECFPPGAPGRAGMARRAAAQLAGGMDCGNLKTCVGSYFAFTWVSRAKLRRSRPAASR